eukprot:5821275-Heterocapsa_arctica.AAC.1
MKTINLATIFRFGLRPGGVEKRRGGKRNASNFNAFLPDDPRNIVGGREQAMFDAVIVFKATDLVKGRPTTISHNGVIACEEM